MNVSELSGTLVCNALTAVKSPAPNDCGQSVYGCCPDGVTEASGPDYAGCQQKDAIPHGYCVETEFGCCPDGVTAARGPSGRGCPDVPCYVCTARRAPVYLSFSLCESICMCVWLSGDRSFYFSQYQPSIQLQNGGVSHHTGP